MELELLHKDVSTHFIHWLEHIFKLHFDSLRKATNVELLENSSEVN